MIGNDQKLSLRFIHSSCTALYYSVTSEHREDRSNKAANVHQQSHMICIIAVQPGFLCDLQFIPSVNLSPSGETGLNIVCSVSVSLFQQIILIPQCRSGTDHCHISPEDVYQLRQFVQACPAQPFPGFCKILIRILQQMGRHIMRCVHSHAPKFVQHEMALVDAHSLLFKKYRSTDSLFCLYGNGYSCHHR